MNIILFGPNGSGKGTQGAMLKEAFGLAHIESGGIFREHIGKGTELGKKAKAYIDRGDLVPDDITVPMVLETLKERSAQGWLLDGFPRNLVQAGQLQAALRAENIALDYVVEIDLPRDIARARIMGRRICAVDGNHPNNVGIEALAPRDGRCRVCGGALGSRADDQDIQAINKRHDIYYDAHAGTLAAAAFFKNAASRYVVLDGRGDIAAVKAELRQKLGL
jgi:adenylate kinase